MNPTVWESSKKLAGEIDKSRKEVKEQSLISTHVIECFEVKSTEAFDTSRDCYILAFLPPAGDGAADVDPHLAYLVSCKDVPRLQRALNAKLPDDVAVRVVSRVPAGFHARYDARAKQ